jgi:hypothetical protein
MSDVKDSLHSIPGVSLWNEDSVLQADEVCSEGQIMTHIPEASQFYRKLTSSLRPASENDCSQLLTDRVSCCSRSQHLQNFRVSAEAFVDCQDLPAECLFQLPCETIGLPVCSAECVCDVQVTPRNVLDKQIVRLQLK